MNIKSLYSTLNKTLPDAFANSEFTSAVDNHIGDVIKSLVIGYAIDDTDDDIDEVSLQLATGGMSNKTIKNTNKDQKWSFCKELNDMNTSLVGLLGFDFSKYLFALIGIKQILQNMIADISKVRNYGDLLKQCNEIRAAYSLNSDDNESLIIDESFDIHKYLNNPNKTKDDGTPILIYYLASKSSSDVKEVLFNYINTYINERSSSRTENLLTVIGYVREILSDLHMHTTLGTYTIKSIDMLCLNLGVYDICYAPSFLKCFNVYYNQVYGDIVTDEYPHISIINNILNDAISLSAQNPNVNKNIKRINTKILIEKLKQYYSGVFTNVKANALEVLHENVLNVVCTTELINNLAHLTVFLFVQIARNLTNNLVISKYCGESTRVQFKHFLEAIVQCAPQLETFNASQRNALYWILCPAKAIENSLKILAEPDKLVNETV